MLLRKEQLLSRLHFFIFGATIVGETAVTSLIVSSFGSEILGKLYLLNGAILLLLPLLFFKKIDHINRGDLLKNVLKIATVLIAFLFVIYEITDSVYPNSSRFVLILFYPVSYLLKTILFLTFWIMATDISEPAETKTIFPRIASSGFIGGLSGAILSWIVLNFIQAELMLLFWSILYLVSYFSVNRVVTSYNDKLIPKEALPSSSSNHFRTLFSDAQEVFKNSLVRNIAVLHFGIFVSIFLVDYHFWQQCNSTFSGAGKLSQFQYGFYVFHSLITIGLLRYVTPDLIALRGFTRIFSYLPMTLFLGSILYLTTIHFWGLNRLTFSILLLWQLFRYLAFENFFSPIYQMFFAAVEKEKRGRAKTVIEGVVKPLAIISASILIFIINKHSVVLVSVICVTSLLLFIEALKIKHAYMKSLVRPQNQNGDGIDSLVMNIGSNIESECIDLIHQFAEFSSQDMKRAAIKFLVKMDRNESKGALNRLVMESNDILLIREAARYAGEIKNNIFLLYFLVEHEDPKVWHRAVLSLILNKTYLSEFRTHLTRYFWVGEPEDRVYSGMYLCSNEKSSDLPHLRSFLDSLYKSDQNCSIELAVLGLTVLQLEEWESRSIQSLSQISSDVSKIVIRHIFEVGSEKSKFELLSGILASDHERNFELLFREIHRSAEKAVVAVDAMLNCCQLPLEKTNLLIRALGSVQTNHNLKVLSKLDGVKLYAESKLIDVYEIAAALHQIPAQYREDESFKLVDIALKDQMLFAAECAIDSLAILDETGFIAEGRRDLRVEEPEERVALIELLETSADSLLKDLTIPILESFDISVYAEMTATRLRNFVLPKRIFESSNTLVVSSSLWLYLQLQQSDRDLFNIESLLNELSTSKNEIIQTLSLVAMNSDGVDSVKSNEAIKVLNRVLFLKRNELFASVSAVRLMSLAEGIQEVIYEDGALISREGDRANHLYLLKEGTADLVVGNGSFPVKFGELVSGEAYGEVGLFNQDIRSATVIATSRCRVYVLSRSYLRKMVSQIPELANTFLQVLGRKLQTSHDEVVRLQKSVSDSNCQ